MTDDFLNITEKEDFTKWYDKYNISHNDLSKYIKNGNMKIKAKNNVATKLQELDGKNYKKIQILNGKFADHTHLINTFDIQLDPTLKKKVMDNIPKNLDKLSMALAIYVELNKVLRFDLKYWALKGSNFNEDVLNLFFKDSKEINQKNNRVICALWSKIYGKLIEEAKTGIKVYINEMEQPSKGDPREKLVNGIKSSNFSHRFIFLVDDDFILAADATDSLYNNKDKTSTTDLVRAQLGWEPAGINALYSTSDIDISEIYKSMGYKFYGLSVKEKAELSKDIHTLNEIMGTRESLTNKLLNVNGKKDLNINFKKIDFILENISEISKNKNLEPYEIESYLSNFMYFVLSKEERENVKLLDCYRKENNRYMLYPLIRFNLGTATKKEYKYLLYEEGRGFYQTSYKKLKNRQFIVDTYNLYYIIDKKFVNEKNIGEIEKIKQIYRDEYNEEIKVKER